MITRDWKKIPYIKLVSLSCDRLEAMSALTASSMLCGVAPAVFDSRAFLSSEKFFRGGTANNPNTAVKL